MSPVGRPTDWPPSSEPARFLASSSEAGRAWPQRPARGLQFDGVGLDGNPRPDLEPYLSAQTTWGSDAHFEPPAMRTEVPVHPHAQQRLAAAPPGSPWHSGREGAVGSDPEGTGAPFGRGAVRVFTPGPEPSKDRSPASDPCRKAVQRRLGTAKSPLATR